MKFNMKKHFNIIILLFTTLVIFVFMYCTVNTSQTNQTIQTSSSTLSNKKIGWGIKRGKDHKQPDVGSVNKKILDTYDGICMGNADSKYVYLTFDEGYEAGYTSKILAVLKENEVPAAFFITAHYLNTQPELVKQMIDEGHIVGNHTPISLMSRNGIEVKC